MPRRTKGVGATVYPRADTRHAVVLVALVLAAQCAYRGRDERRRRSAMTTIVVGTDTSSAADLAVEDAARLARDRDAELMVRVRAPEPATCARWSTPARPADPNDTSRGWPSGSPMSASPRRVEHGRRRRRHRRRSRRSCGPTRSSWATGARTARGGGSGTACRTSSCDTRRAACHRRHPARAVTVGGSGVLATRGGTRARP